MIQVKNRKTGKIAYIVNEGEKVTLQFEDKTTKEYTIGSFKKMYVKTGEVKVKEKVANIEQDENIQEQEQMQMEERVEEVQQQQEEEQQEEVKEKTLVEKVLDEVNNFVERCNSEEQELAYIERKTISKVALNGRNLFEIDIQKRGVVFYFNTSQLQEENVKLMTKILEGYDWSSDGVYKVVSETQFENLNKIMEDALKGKIVANEVKEQEKLAKQLAKEEEKKKAQEKKIQEVKEQEN